MDKLSWRTILLVLVLVVALVCAGQAIMQSMAPPAAATPTVQPSVRAWDACTAAVQRNFGATPADAEPFQVGDMHALAQSTYTITVSYPKHGTLYACKVSLFPDGTADVTDITHRP